jgi:hypothetical protein
MSMRARLLRSWHKNKKWVAVFKDEDGTITRTHFGCKTCLDYTIYHKIDPDLATQKRRHYIARHAASGQEDWTNPTTAGALSRWVLWEHPTIPKAWRAYMKRFNLKPYT